MDSARPSWMSRTANTVRALFWTFLLLSLVMFVVLQFFGSRGILTTREDLLKSFEQDRKSRVIAMIHRQENVSFLGVPVSSSISIEDSEAVLRAIRFTPSNQPIDLILHTPGGLVLAAEQIAKALVEHKGKVTVFVPHYAMSGGTLIALAADEIVMDTNAVLGPVDPQIGGMPAASIVKILEYKKPAQISDEMLILADMAQKARVQVVSFVAQVLLKHLPEKKAIELATILSEGRWTHDFPLPVQAVQQFGLKVSTDMPRKDGSLSARWR
jgi:ClpP class serine protease